MKRVLALLAFLLLAACDGKPAAALQGDAVRGKIALTQYACNACHIIPGVTGSQVFVGKPLSGLGERRFIAGALPVSQDNLVKWIMNPRAIDPLTAMPVLGVSERDAHDMAAFLMAQR